MTARKSNDFTAGLQKQLFLVPDVKCMIRAKMVTLPIRIEGFLAERLQLRTKRMTSLIQPGAVQRSHTRGFLLLGTYLLDWNNQSYQFLHLQFLIKS